MGVVFVALYLGITFSFAVTRAEQENLRATQIIMDRLEGIRLFTWNEIQDPARNPTAFTNSFTTAGPGSGILYAGAMALTTNPALNPAATYSSNILMITVTVRWASGNRTNSRSMSTYASKYGVQNYVYAN